MSVEVKSNDSVDERDPKSGESSFELELRDVKIMK